MEYYNAEMNAFVCPCDGCRCSYKSLATLNNHFNRKHPRDDKPVSIVDDMLRQSDAKYQAKIDAKAIVVNGLNYQAFKKAKFAELPAEMTFADKNKAISAMWKEAKEGKTPAVTVVTKPVTQPEPVIETVTQPETFEETFDRLFKDATFEDLKHLLMSDVVVSSPAPEELPMPSFIVSKTETVTEEPTIETIEERIKATAKYIRETCNEYDTVSTDTDRQRLWKLVKLAEEEYDGYCKQRNDLMYQLYAERSGIDDNIEKKTVTDDEPVTEEPTNEPTEEPKEDTWWNKTDDDVKTYDADLVECCKMWHCGGFTRAYRLVISPDELIIAESKEPKAPYMMHTLGDRPQICSLPEVKAKLENVWDAMCDAWCDYTNAEDFDHTDKDLFDDMTNYEDVADDLVNEETISGFFGM